MAQLGSIKLDNSVRAQIIAVLSAGERPVTMDRARLERQMRELALEHAAARIDDAAYLDRMARLRDRWTPSGRSRRTTYRGNERWSGSMLWPKPGTRPT